MIKIICNGQEKEIAESTYLADFIRQLGMEPESVVVECDGSIVKPDAYEKYKINDGAKLELIRFVGGG